jgi:HEAT repeats
LTARFHAMLDAYRHGLNQAPHPAPKRPPIASWFQRLWPVQPAFQCGLLIFVFASGLLLGPNLSPRRDRNLSAGRAADPDLAQLRQEVSDMKRLFLLSLLDHQSASERLRALAWADQLAHPGEQVLSALLRSLDSDPNVNVRLAAVNALRPFAADAAVRKGLLRSLDDQTSPLVQIELINLMVDLDARDSIPELKVLLQRQELNPAVRERAEWGLQNLG